jgi:hypothetical protein
MVKRRFFDFFGLITPILCTKYGRTLMKSSHTLALDVRDSTSFQVFFIFHFLGGDNDSTGDIACSWWGALHGMKE